MSVDEPQSASHTLVIGGGVIGVCCAWYLSKRGACVTVLEREGMVERRGDPTDGRVALVSVTKTGSDFVRSRRRAGAEAFAQLIDKLSDEDAATLAAAIPALEHLRALGEGSSRASGGQGEIAR